MIGSEKVRAARKKGQLDRLAAKKKSKGNSYANYFSNLPKQLLKAQVNNKISLARQDLKDAIENLQIAEETGENVLEVQETAQVAALYLEKLEASKKPISMASLTAAKEIST